MLCFLLFVFDLKCSPFLFDEYMTGFLLEMPNNFGNEQLDALIYGYLQRSGVGTFLEHYPGFQAHQAFIQAVCPSPFCFMLPFFWDPGFCNGYWDSLLGLSLPPFPVKLCFGQTVKSLRTKTTYQALKLFKFLRDFLSCDRIWRECSKGQLRGQGPGRLFMGGSRSVTSFAIK